MFREKQICLQIDKKRYGPPTPYRTLDILTLKALTKYFVDQKARTKGWSSPKSFQAEYLRHWSCYHYRLYFAALTTVTRSGYSYQYYPYNKQRFEFKGIVYFPTPILLEDIST